MGSDVQWERATSLTILLFLGVLCVLCVVWWFWPEVGLRARFVHGRELARRAMREDALKHMYKRESREELATMESLAGVLQVSTSEVASVLEELEALGLIVREADVYHLTQEGCEAALFVIRAHRLWERFLAERTGHGELDWHRQAEWVEHQISPESVEALDRHLGRPTYDPHGDPIPSQEGEYVPLGGSRLTQARLHVPLRIVHIEDEPEVIYAQLLAQGLHPGMVVRLTERSAERLRFWGGGDEHVLAPLVAANIQVEEQEAEEAGTHPEALRLSSLGIGEKARILELSPRIRGLERRRLMDLGFLPGTALEVELESPQGDPKAYRVREALIALRAEQAKQIYVEHLTKEEGGDGGGQAEASGVQV